MIIDVMDPRVLVVADLIQEGGVRAEAAVAVVAEVTVGVVVRASLQKPNLHAVLLIDPDQGLLLAHALDQSLALCQDHDQDPDLRCLLNK